MNSNLSLDMAQAQDIVEAIYLSIPVSFLNDLPASWMITSPCRWLDIE